MHVVPNLHLTTTLEQMECDTKQIPRACIKNDIKFSYTYIKNGAHKSHNLIFILNTGEN